MSWYLNHNAESHLKEDCLVMKNGEKYGFYGVGSPSVYVLLLLVNE